MGGTGETGTRIAGRECVAPCARCVFGVCAIHGVRDGGRKCRARRA